MPCAAGDLCQLPNEELIAPNGHECGHECRGGCGGRLHGLCGEVEDGSDTPTHRICHTCISKRSPSNSAKRKEGQGFLQPDARKKKKTQESGSRKRLSFEEKLEIIKLLDSKVARPEVARRFGCGITAIASVKREKAALEAAAATNARSASSKSARGGATLEDQEDIAEALAADAKDALTERMAGIVAEEIDPSDDEKELNESGDAENGGGRKVEAPPPYSDLSSCFGPLEQKAESAGNSEAAHFLRKAKMAFLAAHAAKPTRQADIRMFSES